MKKLIALVFCFPVVLFAQNAPAGKFTLSGKLNDFSPESTKKYLHICYVSETKEIWDTAKLVDNEFIFSGTISEPVAAIITPHVHQKKPVDKIGVGTVVLMPGKLTVTFNKTFYDEKVTGSKAHDEYTKFKTNKKRFFDDIRVKDDALRKLHNTKEIVDKMALSFAAKTEEDRNRYSNDEDVKKVKAARVVLDKANINLVNEYVKYLKGTPNTLLLAAFMRNLLRDEDVVSKVYQNLSNEVKNWPTALKMKGISDGRRNTQIGIPAIEFTQNDVNGNPISLSSFKGKYVLIDFWASWCGPCRAENPNVVAAYNKFKDKNFTILGVSLDDKKEKWLKAIEDDQLPWTHVSDLKGWDNAVSKTYGVRGVPANLLISPNGKIIAKNLRGEELGKKLEEVLK